MALPEKVRLAKKALHAVLADYRAGRATEADVRKANENLNKACAAARK